MATVKVSAQETVVDLSDGYSVSAVPPSYTFQGTTSGAKASSATFDVAMMCGTSAVACEIESDSVECPSGVSYAISSTDKSLLTLTASTSFKGPGTVKMTVRATDTGVELSLGIPLAVALTGQTGNAGRSVKGITNHYLASASPSGVTTSTSGWTTSVQSTDSTKRYLWNYETVSYENPTSSEDTTPRVIGTYGSTGATGRGISKITEHYAVSASNTTAPSTWTDDKLVSMTATNRYLWNYETVTYSDGKTEDSTKTVIGVYGDKGDKGQQGDKGADGLAMSIDSPTGTVFKNGSGTITLTAHVYQSGRELSSDDVAKLGTIRWYKGDGTTAVATGATCTVKAADVDNFAAYRAQLEA